MTAALPEGLATDGIRSLEVRWILPGQLENAVARWFGRFPAEAESREDTYLLKPALRGLSVKIRAGRALDVKVHQGSAGTLDVAGRARSRMESWQKWSFPVGPLSHEGTDPPGWRQVAKQRRISRFSLGGGIVAGGPGTAREPACAVELTAIRVGGEAWWSLGFEATGPDDLLRNVLEATAGLVFAQPLPPGEELGMDDSMSYAEWLHRWPGAIHEPSA
jgi:hypothetical protein